jgi:hypothetical protein
LAGEAGRFREPIPDGAGQDDPLRGTQVDQVTDTSPHFSPDFGCKR